MNERGLREDEFNAWGMNDAQDYRAADSESKEDREKRLNQAVDAVIFDGPFDPGAELVKLKEEKDQLNSGDELSRFKFGDKLLEFKAKLRLQREGIDEILNSLFQMVHKNHDLSAQDLMVFVNNKAENIGLNQNQIEIFERAINEYENRHNLVEDYRRKYSDEELFEQLAGTKPDGEIKIEVLPANLNIFCRNYLDFDKLYKLGNNSVLVPGSINGFSYSDTHGLASVVTASRLMQYDQEYMDTTVVRHEEQHKFNQIFKPANIKYDQINSEAYYNSAVNSVDSITRNMFKGLLINYGIDAMIMDELLAQAKGGKGSDSIKETMETAYSYDYLAIQQNNSPILDQIANETIERIHELGEERSANNNLYFANPDRESIKENMKFLYKAQMDKWIKCISVLEDKHYSKPEIVNMLYIESIWNWPNIVNRAKKIDPL